METVLCEVKMSSGCIGTRHTDGRDDLACPGHLVAKGEVVFAACLLENVTALCGTDRATGCLALLARDLDQLLLEVADQIIKWLFQKF